MKKTRRSSLLALLLGAVVLQACPTVTHTRETTGHGVHGAGTSESTPTQMTVPALQATPDSNPVDPLNVVIPNSPQCSSAVHTIVGPLALTLQDLEARTLGAPNHPATISADAYAAVELILASRTATWGEGAVTPHLVEAQGLVRPDEAVLIILPSLCGTYLVALRHNDARWYRADVSDEQLTAAVAQLRRQLEGTALHRGPDQQIGESSLSPAFDRMTSWNTYSRLLRPLEPYLQNAAQVTVIASGSAQAIPFAALVAAPPEGEDNDPAALRATSWLGDRHVFVSAPSLAQWRSLRTGLRAPREHMYIGFGDPNPPQLGGRPLLRLPGTRQEIQQVASLFPADRQRVWLGEDASERTAKSRSLSEATILHFATMGFPAAVVPDLNLPAIVLTASDTEDGWLTSKEVAGLQLNADLVIANGCSTSGSMAEAFLRAGARSGLAVHGTVSDDVATEFVTAMMTAAMRETSGDYVRAFQRARQQLRASPDDRFAHPSSWAQFGLFGDPPSS